MKTAVAWLAVLVVTLGAYGYQPHGTSASSATGPAPAIAAAGSSGFGEVLHLVTTAPHLLAAVAADADTLLRIPRLLQGSLESAADEAVSSARGPHR